MMRAFRLTAFPRRLLLLRWIPSLVLIYCILLPAQLMLPWDTDRIQSARILYTLAQVFLPTCLLWRLFAYFLPIRQSENRELLRSLKHPDIGCAVFLLLEHQLCAFPAYITYFELIPDQGQMIIVLILQSVCISIGFLLLSEICASSAAGFVVLLLYILFSAMFNSGPALTLIQRNILWQEITLEYFIIRLILIGIEVACWFAIRRRKI